MSKFLSNEINNLNIF